MDPLTRWSDWVRAIARTSRFHACAFLVHLRFGRRIVGNAYLIRRPLQVQLARGARVHIGRRVVIEPGVRIACHSLLVIEDDVYIGKNVTISAMGNISIGKAVLIAENVSIHSENHGPAGRRNAYTIEPVYIGDESWLGAGVVVLAGVSIGPRATVGANAVVNRDVPADCVAVGVPARVIRTQQS